MELTKEQKLEIRLDEMTTRINLIEEVLRQLPHVVDQPDPSKLQGLVIEPAAVVPVGVV